jgi:nucleotide-binding universal stress UspA family protein
MVPLDGSDPSESALPHAVALATVFGSRLVLARIVAPVRVPASVYAVPFAIPQEPITETVDFRVDAVQSYLNEMAARIRGENPKLEVTTGVRVSHSTAPALLEIAGSSSVDTIAVATHARGASRLIAPSIADKILRGGPEAVLVLRAEESA